MTREFASGNFENRFKLTANIKEFRNLADTFHDMAESLSESQEKLHKS